MRYFVAGSKYEIEMRLGLEHRQGDIVSLHLIEPDGSEWIPSPQGELFPVCPIPGDRFVMRSAQVVGGEDTGKTEHKVWRVKSRTLLQSGFTATEMVGIVTLRLELEK